MTNVNIYSSVSNGETTLKNEDSINVRTFCFLASAVFYLLARSL